MDLNSPLVSIIVPSYNHEKYIEQAILSIMRQTYRNYELLVVDDGSTDGSAKILQRLSDTYGFKLIVQKNTGIVGLFNKYIPQCKGKYIAFLSSDDYWALDKLEKQVAYMEKNEDVGAIFGNTLAIDENGEILPSFFQRFSGHRKYSFYDIITFNAPFAAPSNMFRRETYEKVGLYDAAYPIEDLYMNLKITHSNYKIGLLPDLVAFYRIHGQNLSKRNRFIFENKLKTIAQYKNEEGYKKGAFKTYMHYYMHVILSFIPKALFPFKRN